MRSITNLNQDWQFCGPTGEIESVCVPHTWNAIDGQDGGNDYWRGTCTYTRHFATPQYDSDAEGIYLQFDGVNATADVMVNGVCVAHHDGGYSTFRANITQALAAPGSENELVVKVDNSVNDYVYPQKADFTFYGGIYRDVDLIQLSATHIALEHWGGPGIRITPRIEDGESDAKVQVETWIEGPNAHTARVQVVIQDAQGSEVARGEGADVELEVSGAHRWDGVLDPYLYSCTVSLLDKSGAVIDTVSRRFGVRSFHVDADKGFFLNGRSYPLRGVSRHQDRRGVGNALTPEMHREDAEFIREIGANTVRLAHYQHSQIFYDLCDELGFVVWAEIPYISEHLPRGRENTITQMRELIVQNHHHASIVCWGISNEITISTKDEQDMLDNHRELNDLCHKMDPTRFTTLACYAMCLWNNKSAHISDVVAWNLYLGWYVPGLFLNKLWFGVWRLLHRRRAIGMSEYGCEGMPNLHSEHPRRNDHTEEYQAIYHEYMLKFFAARPYFWATHVWNMFDFAADARDQGGEAGMNHKGLMTFDRKIKKDAFYIYKAYWSNEPFVHLCSKRFVNRASSSIEVKVYTNCDTVEFLVDGKRLQTVPVRDHVARCQISMPAVGEKVQVEARSAACVDKATFMRVAQADSAYKLQEGPKQKSNWADNE